MTPFERQKGLWANKRLGQNFLVDQNIIQKQIQAAGVTKDDVILEIGPGPGALTAALLETGCQLIAIEKDDRLAENLKEQFDNPNFHLYNEDFLSFDLNQIQANKKIKVVANLPYQITSPILAKLLESYHLFSSITVMVQLEVAKRMVAMPNCSDYSSLTLFLKAHGEVKFNFQVSRNCFFPKPKVESAVVTLKVSDQTTHHKDLFKIVRAAFNQRRKMLRVSLKQLYSKEILSKVDPDILTKRAENLSLNEFNDLVSTLETLKNS